MKRIVASFAAVIVALSACGEPSAIDVTPLQEVSPEAFLAELSASTTPTVVNVWASWCLPCRAEAPLLAQAADSFEDRVTFVGVNVSDRPADAAAFISEFGLDFRHVADQDRAIPPTLGGAGVPITYFVNSDGSVASLHVGIIDERTLVAGINELLER